MYFNQYVNIVFPDIKKVYSKIRLKESTEFLNMRKFYSEEKAKELTESQNKTYEYELFVRSPEAEQKDWEDFALPLSQCGTGVSQVLAILYVVITSSESQVIIIDDKKNILIKFKLNNNYRR